MLASRIVRSFSSFVLVVCTAFPSLAFAYAQRPCATCHPAEAARFQASAMGRSLVAPEPLPSGRITHPASGSVITTGQRYGRMIHTIAEQGLTAEYSIRYQIGGGLMGRTYMVQIGKSLFESPASWFNRVGWDISPGFAHVSPVDFDRPMEQQCLFCHAGTARFDTDGRQLLDTGLTAITCERCHGQGEAHALRPSARNTINPARLAGPARDSVCEQCHLEGVTRVLNPGKNWNDFHAGDRTEQTFATYLEQGSRPGEVIAVSHVEQLAQSQCARHSGGKLWCTTCHDPHGAPAADRSREIKGSCMSCHTTLSAQAHPSSPAECTSCHMPRSDTTDIAHAAITDHRILRRPAPVSAAAPGADDKIIAWREPDATVRNRDLALAQVVVGYSKNARALALDGFNSLQALPEGTLASDPGVLSALEGFALQQSHIEDAVKLGKQSVTSQPQSAKAAMNYAIVLKRSGNLDEAERQLNRAIQLDPSLKGAYMELGMLYAGQRKMRPVLETIDRYLQWNPQDLMFSLQKARIPAQP